MEPLAPPVSHGISNPSFSPHMRLGTVHIRNKRAINVPDSLSVTTGGEQPDFVPGWHD